MCKLWGLVLILMLCAWGRAFSQNSDVGSLKTSLAPASPEAATLFKFQDIPVGKYTGTADINIPLVSVSENNFTWPVSLGYHTSGIKVNEIAGYTGLGWQLNAVGMISRKVRDFPDDHFMGYMNRNDWYSAIYVPLTQSSNTETYTTTAYRVVDGNNHEDTEPDEFYFSFNGYSGKMSFQHTADDGAGAPAKLVVSSQTPLKVTYNLSGGTISAWNIITPDGLKYTFSVTETSRTESTPVNLCNVWDARSEYISSWYLSSITGINGFSNVNVRFSYDDYHVDYDWMASLSESHSSYASSGCYRPIPNESPAFNVSRSRMFVKGKKIRRIDFPGSKTAILFQYINNRLDMQASLNNKTLDEVIVQQEDGYASSAIKQLDKVSLKYFYRGNRLMLQSVQRIGDDNVTSTPPYDFTYNNTELPERNGDILGHHRIDHWGYYNGSQGLLPKFEELTLGNYFYYPLPGGSDKNPHIEMARAQTLEKIKYPTGGITTLEYELNSYGFIQNQPLTSQQLYILKDTSVPVYVAGVNTQYLENSISFTVPPGGLDLKFIVDAQIAPCAMGDDGQTFCYNRNFPKAKLFIERTPGNLEPVKEIQTSLESPYNTWSLPTGEYGSGNYTIKVYAVKRPGPDNTLTDHVTGSLQWRTPELHGVIADRPAGGLRIKKVTDHDSLGGISKIRRFDYGMVVNGQTQSSGVIYKEPKYLYTTYPLVIFTNPATGMRYSGYCTSKSIIASSSIQTAETNGSHIGYRQVAEWEEYKGAPNGKTITAYTSPADYPDDINDEKPFAAPVSQSYKTGQVKSEEVYDKLNVLLKKDSFEYVFFEHIVPYIKISKGLLECPCPDAGPIGAVCSTPNFYTDINGDSENDLYARFLAAQIIGFPRITKEMHTQDGFTIEKLYAYDSALQLVKKITVRNNSADKDSIVISYKHPGDENSISGLTTEELQAIQAMKNQGMITTILQETRTRRNTPLLTVRNHYKNFDPDHQSKIALSGLSVQYGASAMERKYDIEHYDEQGGILQQRKINDFPFSYIRDVMNGRITAEVSNAAYSNIAFTSFESEYAPGSGWAIGALPAYSRNNTDAFSGRYCYSLSDGSITKTSLATGVRYIVSYWSKNGAYNVNGIAAVAGRTNAAGWTYYEHTTSNATTGVTVSGNGLIDELRLFPEQAEMVTYTYETGGAMLSKNTAGNIITHFEYDAMGRLKLLRDQDKNIIRMFDYQFGQQERNVNLQLPNTQPAARNTSTNTNDTGRQIKNGWNRSLYNPADNPTGEMMPGTKLADSPLSLR